MKKFIGYFVLGVFLFGCSQSDIEEKIITEQEVNQIIKEARDNNIQALHYAIQNLRYDIAKILVYRGANVNAEDDRGRNSLYYCSLTQRDPSDYDVDFTSIGKFLICKGADINHRDCLGNTPLHGNAHNTAIIELLISKGANVNVKNWEGETPLHHSVYDFSSTRTNECANLLIEAGADVNAQDKKGRTALHYAVEVSNIKACKLLLCLGADASIKDKKGNTPLMLAQAEGRLEIMCLLSDTKGSEQIEYINFFKAINHDDISYIKDINKTTIDAFMRKYTLSPLILATKLDKVEVAKFLVSRGADINAVCKLPANYKYLGEYLVKMESYEILGWTALHIAVCKDSLEMVRILANKDTVNVKDNDGCTPRCFVKSGSDIAEVLDENGAYPPVSA